MPSGIPRSARSEGSRLHCRRSRCARKLVGDRVAARARRSSWRGHGIILLPRRLGTTIALFVAPIPNWPASPRGGHAPPLAEQDRCPRRNRSSPPPRRSCVARRVDPRKLEVEVARALYTLVGSVALPLLPLRLWWRGRREPLYRVGIGERFGRYRSGTFSAPILWVHSVSVGETRAALPLVQRMKTTYPEAIILLTHMTASGREADASCSRRFVQAWLLTTFRVPSSLSGIFAGRGLLGGELGPI